MPFPIPFIPVVLVALIVAIGIPAILRAARTRIREAHTTFLFNQIASAIRTNNLAQTSDLIRFLRIQHIDWNSCSMDDHAIYDGWGTAIETTFANGSQLILVSAGKDEQLGTKDDITKPIRIENSGQPAGGAYFLPVAGTKSAHP